MLLARFRYLAIILFILAPIPTITAATTATSDCGGQLMANKRAEGLELSRVPEVSSVTCCALCRDEPKCKLFVYGGEWKGLAPTCLLLGNQRAIYDAGGGGDPVYDTVIVDPSVLHEPLVLANPERDPPKSTKAKSTSETKRTQVALTPTFPWGHCGDADHGALVCPSGFYCQPWSRRFYQCMRLPAPTATMLTDVEFVGPAFDEISPRLGLTPEACYQACAAAPKGQCVAMTFVNETPRGQECFLLREVSIRRKCIGAVSSVLGTV